MTEKTDIDRLDDKIRIVEEFLATLGDLGQIDGDKIMLTGTLAQLYQAKGLLMLAQSGDEISANLSGIIAFLDTPAVAELLEQFGLGGGGDEAEDEDEDEEAGEA